MNNTSLIGLLGGLIYDVHMIYQVQMYLKNQKPLHQVERLIPDTPSDNKQENVETIPVNTEIASVNIKDGKTVIKKECDETVNQAPVINFPVFNTDSSQQSLARFIVENNIITLVPQHLKCMLSL